MTHMTMTDFRRELAAILGTDPDRLPNVFGGVRPRALKVGIRFDLQHRYPKADPAKLSDWFGRYTSTREYLKRISHGLNRHDLDGIDAGAIEKESRAAAKRRLRLLDLAERPAMEAAE